MKATIEFGLSKPKGTLISICDGTILLQLDGYQFKDVENFLESYKRYYVPWLESLLDKGEGI